LFPAMTLGCGAVAGNSTSDNVGPLHLVNIKRLAYSVQSAARAGGQVTRELVIGAVKRYLEHRGMAPAAVQLADARGSVAGAGTTVAAPPVAVVDFVCEDDVRRAVRDSRKIFIGPKTIVTPAARDYGNTHDALVMTEAPRPQGRLDSE
jgi:acetaldehyde dehydrogenase (acetylating)